MKYLQNLNPMIHYIIFQDQCIKTQMLKQKLSDIFRRDKKEKVQQPKKQQPTYFNESYFDCKLAYNPHKLSLIKVIANINVGPDAGTPMMVSCKWYIKKNNQYSEIQGVTSSCYQPCIEDVGCSILVQITPLIEGKIYSGALITKQTGPLELGSVLQTQFTQTKTRLYYQKQSIQYNMKVEAVFGKQTQYSNLEYPQDGKFLIRKHEDNNFQIQIITAQFKTYFWITKQFPTTEFIRKSYNSVVISFTQYQSMRLAFKQGADRQIIGLLLRTLTANSTLDWPINQDELKQNKTEKQQQKEQQISRQNQANNNNVSQNNEQTISQNKPMDSQQQNPSESSLSLKKQPQQNQLIMRSQQYQKTSPLRSQKSMGSQQNISIQNSITKSQSEGVRQRQSSSKTIIQYQMRIGQLNTQINKIKKQYKDLMKNYNIQKQNKCKLEIQVKKVSDKVTQFDKIKKQRDQLLINNQKFKQDNRFYRNQVSILNKNIKNKQAQLQALKVQKQTLEKKIQKLQTNYMQQKKVGKKQKQEFYQNQEQNWRKFNNQLTQQNQQLKAQIQKLQNSLMTANKKIQSLHHQKIINNNQFQQPNRSEPIIGMTTPPSSKNYPTLTNKTSIKSETRNNLKNPFQDQLSQKDKIISNLQFKISNLQMLLKHRSGEKGNQSLALHKIINNLTEDIQEKQEQLQSLKKINKQLMDKIQVISSR